MESGEYVPLYCYSQLYKVQFTNDNLLLNKKIAVDFLTSLIEQDLKVKWKGYIRYKFVLDEFLIVKAPTLYKTKRLLI